MGVVYQEDFTGSDNDNITTLGWVNLASNTLVIISNQADPTGAAVREYEDGQAPASEHSAQVDIFSRTSLNGVMVRVVDATNWYWGYYNSNTGNWVIDEEDAGSGANIDTQSEGGLPSDIAAVRLTVDGAQELELFLGAVSKASGTGGRSGTTGTGGIRSQGSSTPKYDDYELVDVSAAAGGSVWPSPAKQIAHLINR